MSAETQKVDALADLRGVVRIAKAASFGVTGNGPRIERAENAISAVAELIEALHAWQQYEASKSHVEGGDSALRRKAKQMTSAALARIGGAA